MVKPVEEFQAEVLKLPAAERSLLLERLIVSLDADPEIQRAWVQEAELRDDEIESGAVTPVPGEEALARIRARPCHHLPKLARSDRIAMRHESRWHADTH